MNNNNDKILQILDQSACLSKGQLMGYLKRNLYPEELRTVELHLSSCALCSDALDGLSSIPNTEALLASVVLPTLPAVVLPEKPIEKKPEVKVEAAPRPTLKKRHSKAEQVTAAFQQQEIETPVVQKVNWLKPLGIAAGLIIVAGTIWYFQFGPGKSKDIFTAETETAESNLMADNATPTDSIQPEVMAIRDSTDMALEKKGEDSLFLLAKDKERRLREKDSLNNIAAIAKDTSVTLIAAAKGKDTNMPQAAMAAPSEQTVSAKKLAETEDTEQDKKEQKSEKSDFELGMQQYKNNNFASALLYFKTAESDDKNPKHWEAVYYCGMCSKSLDKKRRAIKYFERIVEANAPQTKAAQKQLDDLKGQ